MSNDKGNEETLRFLSSSDLPARSIDISGTIDRLPSSSSASSSSSSINNLTATKQPNHSSSSNSNSNGSSSSASSSSASANGIPSTSLSLNSSDNETTWSNCICRTRHPIAAFFHICFKGLALLLYVFHSWLSSTYVTSFVIIILLLAIDFWTVKNITGRLLVGLRWWNRLSEDGLTNEWIYESSPYYNQIPPLDRRLFWSTLYVTPLIFVFFFLTSFLSFSWDWSLISGIGIGLTGANLFGYIKCSKDAQQRLSSTFTGMGTNTLQFLTRTILPHSINNTNGMNGNNNSSSGGTNGIPSSVLSIAVNSALTSFLNVASTNTTTTNGSGSSSSNGGNNANSGITGTVNNSSINNRHMAARSGPGDGMVTSNISDFDAVSDPFGDRHERVVI